MFKSKNLKGQAFKVTSEKWSTITRYDEKGAQQCERAREWSIEGMLGGWDGGRGVVAAAGEG